MVRASDREGHRHRIEDRDEVCGGVAMTMQPLVWTGPKLPGQQCTATSKRSGERCKKLVVDPAHNRVCDTHGGRAPQVQAARRARVLSAQAQLQVQQHVPDRPPSTPEEILRTELGRCEREILGLEVVVEQAGAFPELLPPGMTLSDARDRLTLIRGQAHRVAADMIRLGVSADEGVARDERARHLATALHAVLQAVGLDPNDPDVIAVVLPVLRGLDRQS